MNQAMSTTVTRCARYKSMRMRNFEKLSMAVEEKMMQDLKKMEEVKESMDESMKDLERQKELSGTARPGRAPAAAESAQGSLLLLKECHFAWIRGFVRQYRAELPRLSFGDGLAAFVAEFGPISEVVENDLRREFRNEADELLRFEPGTFAGDRGEPNVVMLQRGIPSSLLRRRPDDDDPPSDFDLEWDHDIGRPYTNEDIFPPEDSS